MLSQVQESTATYIATWQQKFYTVSPCHNDIVFQSCIIGMVVLLGAQQLVP